MTRPVVRGSTFVSSSTASEPSGTVQDDGVYVLAAGSSSIPSLPTGWTSLGTYSALRKWQVAAIIRGASAPSYAFTNASQIFTYSIEGGTFDPSAFLSSVNNFLHKAASTSFDSPAIPTANSDDLAIIVGYANAASSATLPAGFTPGATNGFGEGSGYAVVNDVGTGSYGWTNSPSSQSDAFTVDVPFLAAVTNTTTATFDAALANRRTLAATLDAAFATHVTKTATFDAVSVQRKTLTATLDAALASRATKTAAFDMAAADPTLKTALLDAVLAARVNKTATFDADLMKTQTLTALVDAVLALRQNKTATFDAVLAQHPALAAVFDAVLASVETKTATLDAAFATLANKTATFDALLSGQIFKTATFDAVFGQPLLPMAGRVNGPPPVTAGRAYAPGVPATGVVTGAQPPAAGRVVPHVPGL